MSKLERSFFTEDALQVAPKLLGKYICRKYDDGTILRFQITDVEAYCGEKDLACHASKGRTERTEVMYNEGGHLYVYLIYGVYWLMNIVTGQKNEPQGIMIRGVSGISGPGRTGRALKLDKSFYNEDLTSSKRIWIEDINEKLDYTTTPRIGIKYAGKPWVDKLWRFVHDPSKTEKDPTDNKE